VRHRTHPHRVVSPRRHREPAAGAGVRDQRPAAAHRHLRAGSGPGRGGGGDGRSDLPGQPADGRGPDHRGVCSGGDRRDGLHPGLDRHRVRPGGDRGADQGLLARGIEHGDLRDHGPGAAGATGRAVRENGVTAPAPRTEAAPGTVAPSAPAVAPTTRSLRWPIVAMVVVLAVAPFAVYPVFLMKALCFALFACAFNLLIGFAGLLSFGHALFFGGAGYIAGHAALVWGLPFELAVLTGTVAAAGLGLVVGWLAIRRQGIYFAVITLALAQMFYFFCVRAKFTGGEDGIQGIPRGKLLGLVSLESNYTLYFVVLGLFVFGFLAILRIVHSPFGHVLTAIRENEPRAVSLGSKTDHYKLIAFVLSAALSGLAGSAKSIVFQLASLTDVYWGTSGEVILMVLLGGLGTLFGPVVGAFVIVVVESYLAQIGGWVTVGQGALFVVCGLAFPWGIVGELCRLRHRPLWTGDHRDPR